jgi:hypothetical protein
VADKEYSKIYSNELPLEERIFKSIDEIKNMVARITQTPGMSTVSGAGTSNINVLTRVASLQEECANILRGAHENLNEAGTQAHTDTSRQGSLKR